MLQVQQLKELPGITTRMVHPARYERLFVHQRVVTPDLLKRRTVYRFETHERHGNTTDFLLDFRY